LQQLGGKVGLCYMVCIVLWKTIALVAKWARPTLGVEVHVAERVEHSSTISSLANDGLVLH